MILSWRVRDGQMEPEGRDGGGGIAFKIRIAFDKKHSVPAQRPDRVRHNVERLCGDPASRAAILFEKNHHAFLQLDEHPGVDLGRALAAAIDMNDASGGSEDASPPCAREPKAQVRFFSVDEIVLVEQADLVKRLPAYEHEHARNHVEVALVVSPPPPQLASPEKPRARKSARQI